MTSEQSKNITYLVDRFLESESKGWTNLDDLLEYLEYLTDPEIYTESEALYSIHKTKKMGCPYVHKEGSVCFVYGILDAVEAILNLYEESGSLHPRNRYVLCYYLALSQDGQILILED